MNEYLRRRLADKATPTYLVLKSLGATAFTVSIIRRFDSITGKTFPIKHLYYSSNNGVNWNVLNAVEDSSQNGTQTVSARINVSNGGEVLLYAKQPEDRIYSYGANVESTVNITANGEFAAKGTVASLIGGKYAHASTRQIEALFRNSTNLVDASDLILHVASCAFMFFGCTNLKKAPIIAAHGLGLYPFYEQQLTTPIRFDFSLSLNVGEAYWRYGGFDAPAVCIKLPDFTTAQNPNRSIPALDNRPIYCNWSKEQMAEKFGTYINRYTVYQVEDPLNISI